MSDLSRVDHLVFAAPTLDRGVHAIRDFLDVEPVAGGSHPRWGTRNALVGLGRRRYLEIIAPDPELAAPEEGRPFDVDTLTEPALMTWAARHPDPGSAVEALREAGLETGPVLPGRRRRPDGSVLSWSLTDPAAARAGGVVPFLIDWSGSRHPADDLTHAVELVGLELRHPDPGSIRRILGVLGLEIPVSAGTAPGVRATLARGSARIRRGDRGPEKRRPPDPESRENS